MYQITGLQNNPVTGVEILLEDEFGGSYTLKKDDNCIVLLNNKTNEYATHFFKEAIEAIIKKKELLF